MENYFKKPYIQVKSAGKALLMLNIVVSAIYLLWWLIPGHISNPYLYWALFFGEIYHVLMAITFWHTVWPQKRRFVPDRTPENLNVDIFITVAGEPLDIVQKTILAAKNIRYKNKFIYVLNDGYVAQKDNWQEIEKLAQDLKVGCITRKTAGGAKAGNINNALKLTSGEIVVIFDADMVAYPDFLEKTIPYFKRKDTGFVQSPQYYKNNKLNLITSSAWDQQEFFFGPIMCGKEKSNAVFICGTNVAIRRKALVEAGGMREDNIAEDFLTSLDIHQNGWKSYYVKEVLSEGLAPEDLNSYYKQQLRWARGSLEVLFGSNPIFKKGLTWAQRIEYLSSALFYFNGPIMLLDMLMPLIFFFTGVPPVSSSTGLFAVFFAPFMALNLYSLYRASGGHLTFRAISFSQSSWTLQLLALKSLLFGQKASFFITPKKAEEGNFLPLVYPHLAYILFAVIGATVGIVREGAAPSVIANIAWATFNIALFVPFIKAAYPWEKLFKPSIKNKISPQYQQKEYDKGWTL